jgi:hypothetical protein
VCAEGYSQWVPFHGIAELVGPSAALASSDPCVTPSSKAEDISELTDTAERAKLEERSTACDARKATAACARLVAAIDRREKALPALADRPTAELAQRLSTRAILPADLALSKKDLQCSDALWPHLVSVASEVPRVWAGTLVEAPALGPVRVREDLAVEFVVRRLVLEVGDRQFLEVRPLLPVRLRDGTVLVEEGV